MSERNLYHSGFCLFLKRLEGDRFSGLKRQKVYLDCPHKVTNLSYYRVKIVEVDFDNKEVLICVS